MSIPIGRRRCPVVSLLPKKAAGGLDPGAKRLGSTVLQRGAPVMNCNKLTSSKWTARLGHSWKSCESACPYLVQGTHSFKGNGKGWGLLKCQSRDTQTSYYTICVYIGMRSWFYSLGAALIVKLLKENLPLLLRGGSAPGMMGYMCEYSI